MKKLTLALLSFVVFTATADQCHYLSPEQAAKAQEIVSRHKRAVSYCELCAGDKPKLVAIDSVRNGGAVLEVNGRGYDMAYFFVPSDTNENKYENVSKLVGCPSTGVSTTIQYASEAGLTPNEDWGGRYGSRFIRWELKPDLETSRLTYKASVQFMAKDNFRKNGMLSSHAELIGNVMVMPTAIPGCRFTLWLDLDASLLAEGSEGCGVFGGYVSGRFTKRE